MIIFDGCTETFKVKGRGGIAYIIECPFNCTDFEWIINKEVEVNGLGICVRGICTGVESFAKLTHFKGEKIALLIEDKVASNGNKED